MVNENPRDHDEHRQNKNRDNSDNAPHEYETDGFVRVAVRLRQVDLPTGRFIDVENGRKQSYDHDKQEPPEVDGNYGVYTGYGLIGFDIDDYRETADTSSLEDLPRTFTVETPHGGKHLYYEDANGATEAIRAATGGSENVSLSWGELYAGGKYLVGPGSNVEDCSKSWCYECRNEGQSYSITHDSPIREISAERVRHVLSEDPDFGGCAQAPLGMKAKSDATRCDWQRQLEAEDSWSPPAEVIDTNTPDETLWNLYRALEEEDASERGVELGRLINKAEEIGLGCRFSFGRVRRWIKTGRVETVRSFADPISRIEAVDAGSDSAEGRQLGVDSFL